MSDNNEVEMCLANIRTQRKWHADNSTKQALCSNNSTINNERHILCTLDFLTYLAFARDRMWAHEHPLVELDLYK